MKKTITLLVFLLTLLSIAFAQVRYDEQAYALDRARALWHYKFDKAQEKIDAADGTKDYIIRLNNPANTSKAAKVFFTNLDDMQQYIEQSQYFDSRQKIVILQDVIKILEPLHVNQYTDLDREEEKLTFYYEVLKGREAGNVSKVIYKDKERAFRYLSFINDQPEAEYMINEMAHKDPESIFANIAQLGNSSSATRAIVTASKALPNKAKEYMTAYPSVVTMLQGSGDPAALTLVNMHKELGPNSNAYYLLDHVVKKRYSIRMAHSVSNSDRSLIGMLSSIMGNEDAVGRGSAEKKLKDVSLEYVRKVNSLHETKNPKVRFASVENFTASELYALIVYSPEEIFTSTYFGFYKRMVDRWDVTSGEGFLQILDYNKYRTFIKLSAGFGNLDEFLSTMDNAAQQRLMTRFVSDLEKTGDIAEAVNVADTFGSLEDEDLLGIMRTTVKSEYSRVIGEDHKEGRAIYGLLSKFFVERVEYGDAWFNGIASQYGLPSITSVGIMDLIGENGKIIQQHFFFDDDDGKDSYASFISNFKTSNWKIEDKDQYIKILSLKGYPVIIYANKPEYDIYAQPEIFDLFATEGIAPSIIVHRGHSFYVDYTIKGISEATKIVFLGSCGSYHNIEKVLERSPMAHIISSRQTGTARVNDPLIKQMSEDLRNSKNIDWPEFWKRLGNKIGTGGVFSDYVPPHKNLGALYIQAYYKVVDQDIL